MDKSSQALVEMDCVHELRKRLDTILNPNMKDDIEMFKRFLKARNYDLDAAEVMLRNHIKWREVHKVDDILSWYTPSLISKFVPYSFIGFDKEGNLVSFCPAGNVDFLGINKTAISLMEMKCFYINFLETYIKMLEAHSLKLKKEVGRFIFIYDFENFSLKAATHKLTLEKIGKIISLFDENYPERLKMVVVYNASFYFQLLYAVVRHLITGATVQKIKIFGKTGWQEELQKHIDCDVLPAFLGGNRTDPDGDPTCKTFIKPAEIVPETLYTTHKKREFENQSGVKKIIINRLSSKLIKLHVMNSDSNIEWEFTTKDKDIYFCLLFQDLKNSTEDAIEVIPKQRIDASVAPETGIYKCEKSGIYIIEFDNSYSWIHQKEVYYKVQIIPSHTPNSNLHSRSV